MIFWKRFTIAMLVMRTWIIFRGGRLGVWRIGRWGLIGGRYWKGMGVMMRLGEWIWTGGRRCWGGWEGEGKWGGWLGGRRSRRISLSRLLAGGVVRFIGIRGRGGWGSLRRRRLGGLRGLRRGMGIGLRSVRGGLRIRGRSWSRS